MGLKNRLKQQENLTASLLLTAAVFAVFVTGWDFYYDLNDDVLIKDILSGVYSGSPSGYTMQLLYPLGFVLSVLYRGLSVPVFGVFLILCQLGAVWAVGYQSAACCKTRAGKAIVLAAEGLLWTAAFGMHFVYVQYTVTAGMLAGAALFWILTAKRRRWIALLLYWLAFCLRTEMALLILPLACIAGLCTERKAGCGGTEGSAGKEECGGTEECACKKEKRRGSAVCFPLRGASCRHGHFVCGGRSCLFRDGVEAVPAVF